MNKPGGLQIHLSTALALTLSAAVMLWMNFGRPGFERGWPMSEADVEKPFFNILACGQLLIAIAATCELHIRHATPVPRMQTLALLLVVSATIVYGTVFGTWKGHGNIRPVDLTQVVTVLLSTVINVLSGLISFFFVREVVPAYRRLEDNERATKE